MKRCRLPAWIAILFEQKNKQSLEYFSSELENPTRMLMADSEWFFL